MLQSSTQKICQLFAIKYPIIQAGMVWVSGAKLAAAASNAGILGIIGAGSMPPPVLKQHLLKARSLTSKPFGVNLPLLYHGIQEQIDLCLEHGVKIFFTSAGSPKKYTSYLKKNKATVVHVCSSLENAKKCQAAGVDAIVAEGFEAGGHNGREELTTMSLIPKLVSEIKLPIIAAGGIVDHKTMAAAFCLGASAVQMGTRFLMTQESSAHQKYKDLLLNAKENDTELCMKQLVPVRLFKNKFYDQVKELEQKRASNIDMLTLLGKGRAKAGMLMGELDQGELEIGQAISNIKDLPRVEEIVSTIISQYQKMKLPSI